jgi:5-formyltetrahydrofolate cyclo-ligase
MTSLRAAEPDKPALRAQTMALRDALPAKGRARGSLAIAARAAALIAVMQPRVVAGYLPIRSEVDPRPLLERLRAATIIALPAVTGRTSMVFRRFGAGETMTIGAFGTLAPDDAAPILTPDLVILPVVAFDRTGARLGHGRGFYDRALADMTVRPVVMGIAFAVQEVARVPREVHDVRLDWLVTEDEAIDARGQG